MRADRQTDILTGNVHRHTDTLIAILRTSPGGEVLMIIITRKSQHPQECNDPHRHCFCDS